MGGDVISEQVDTFWSETMVAALSGLDYHIQNLEGPLGFRDPMALGLNEFGAVAGKAYGYQTGLQHGDTGIVWSGGLPDIILPPTIDVLPSEGPLPRYGSGLNDINWQGVTVGWRELDKATGGDIAIQSVGTVITDIPVPGQARATGINDAGLICGWSGSPTATSGFLYDRASGALRPIGLAGAASSRATAINNLDEVAGESGGLAFLDSGGKTTPLGPISHVTGVNDAGIVVGSRNSPGHGDVPVLCDARSPTPAWTQLPLLPRRTGGQAEGVNRFGHVVGSCWDKSGLRDAFIHKDGVTTNLNLVIDEPGWHLETAYDINDRGQICGNGTFHGAPAAFLLTPPLILLVPPRYRRWPIELPAGPPRPDEVALRDGSILIALHQAATSIADAAVRERVRSALFEATRTADADRADRTRTRREPAAAGGSKPRRVTVPAESRQEAPAELSREEVEQ